MRLPKAIYLDTNIIFQLGGLQVDFLELRELTRSINVKFFIPELVFKERVNQMIRNAQNEMNKLGNTAKRLGRILERKALKHEILKQDYIESVSTDNLLRYLNKAKIFVIPTPNKISLNTIIDMAVRRIAPFEKIKVKDKEVLTGFNDTIILFTIIEHMKTKKLSNAFFVTNDNIFQRPEVRKRFEDNKINVSIFNSISVAKETLKTSLDKMVMSLIEERNTKIKAFLETKKKDIFEFVKENAEISEPYLMGRRLVSALEGESPIEGRLEEILDFSPKEISKVFYSHLASERAVAKNVEQITFSVTVDFRILISYEFPPKEKVISLETLKEDEEMEEFYYEKDERIVEREITIEAVLYKKNEEYDKLKLLRTIPN